MKVFNDRLVMHVDVEIFGGDVVDNIGTWNGFEVSAVDAIVFGAGVMVWSWVGALVDVTTTFGVGTLSELEGTNTVFAFGFPISPNFN